MPDEAHDFFELLDTLDTEEEITEAYAKVCAMVWWKNTTEEAKEAIAARLDEKIAEVTGE